MLVLKKLVVHLFDYIFESLHFKSVSLAQLLTLDLELHLCALLLCNQLLKRFACVFMFLLHLLCRLSKRLKLFNCVVKLRFCFLKVFLLLVQLNLVMCFHQKFNFFTEFFEILSPLCSPNIVLSL